MKSYLPDPGSKSSPAGGSPLPSTPPRLNLFAAAAAGTAGLLCVRLCAGHAVRILSLAPHSGPCARDLVLIPPDKETEAQRRQAACPRSHSRVGIRSRCQSLSSLQGPQPAAIWSLICHGPKPSERLEFGIGVRLRASQGAGSHLLGEEWAESVPE